VWAINESRSFCRGSWRTKGTKEGEWGDGGTVAERKGQEQQGMKKREWGWEKKREEK